MSNQDEALALLRERFPEPWKVHIEAMGGNVGSAIASVRLGAVVVSASRPWELFERPEGIMDAARACIAAWDEATKAERLTTEDYARAEQVWREQIARANGAESAERELSDRLAEALMGVIGVADLAAALEDVEASATDAESKGLRALSAWRAARGKALGS